MNDREITIKLKARSEPRQRRWAMARIARGLCGNCGRRSIVTNTRCRTCVVRQRVAKRQRLGCHAWRPRKRGRPPIEALA